MCVTYMHDLSLTTNVREVLSNPQEVENRYKWRYRLRWREPERISAIVDRTSGNWFYWMFIAGSVEDKLEREHAARLKKDAARGRHIWDLARKDMELNPFAPQPDRDLWKKKAMENVAKFHQTDYDNKSFTDPLGVAVQQILGIGLSFMDDHTRRLKKGEMPSPRRLQARAAKSAIARVQNLYKERNQQTAEVMEKVKDPQKRQKQIDRIRERVDDEVASLAKRLSDLIPTETDPGDGPGLKFQNFIPNSTIKAGGRTLHVSLPTDRSIAVESLLRQYGDKSATGKGSKEGTEDNDHSDPSDAIEVVPLDDDSEAIIDDNNEIETQQPHQNRDEFMESYLKQKFGGNTNKGGKDNDSDDDDDQDIVFV